MGEEVCKSATELRGKLAESASKKKPLNADMTDISKLWDTFRFEMNAFKAEAFAHTQDSSAMLRSRIEITEHVAHQGVEDASVSLKTAQAAQISADKQHESIKQQASKAEKEFAKRTEEVNDSIIPQLVQLETDAETSNKLLVKQIEAVQENTDVQKAEVLELMENAGKERTTIRKEMSTLNKELLMTLSETVKTSTLARSRLEATMLERLERVCSDASQARMEMQTKLAEATDNAFNRLNDKLELAASEQRVAMGTTRESLIRSSKSDIEELQQEMLQVSRACSGVANIPTRRVQWIIRDAAMKLRLQVDDDPLHPGEHMSLLSRQFEAAGSRGLQFELVRFGGANFDITDNRDCAVRLMADKGLRLIFRLSVGDAVHQMEHTFNGEEPFSTGRFCVLGEHVRHEDDTLSVCLEILESVVQLESRTSLAALGVPELDCLDEEVNDTDTFVFHRYLNHRMLDLMQNQVDVMNSRMTRKVEWRIEKASKLTRFFASGEAMCSATFVAAGLAGMQFIFYPSGFVGSKEGFCSCFLFYPGQSSLRCWLTVGRQRFEAKPSVSSPGFFGRTNFCRFDQAMDAASDTIVLLVEIDEAQQEMSRFLSHQAEHGNASVPGDTGTSTSMIGGQGDGQFESVLRVQKQSGHLQDVKQLPSIWTATPQVDVANSLVGTNFQSIKDLPAKRRQRLCDGGRPLRAGMMASSQRDGDDGRALQESTSPDNDNLDMYRPRPGDRAISSMSLYSDRDPSRPESRQRPGSRAADPGDREPDQQRANSTMSMYSDIPACPPATARPAQRSSVRDMLSARYAAYMT